MSVCLVQLLIASALTAGLVAMVGGKTGQDALKREPAVLVAGESIDWSELRPRLAEAAGAMVLEEAVLDRLVARELKDRGITLEAGGAQREGSLLAQSLATTAGAATPDEQVRLLEAVRRSRGLGDTRYKAMLQRNASLRRLVRDEVKVTPEDVDQACEIRFGAKYKVRIIVVGDATKAAIARARVSGEEGRAGENFSDVAAEVSTDASRQRGGLLDPLSTADPTYPSAFRQAVAALEPGQVSKPVAVDGGLAIVKLEAKVPAAEPPSGDARSAIEREVRLVRERVQMDKLASRLLASNNVTIMDPSLDWSWRARERAATSP